MMAATLQQIESKFASQHWRLNHLYKIRDIEGKTVTFKMNEAQEQLYRDMHYFNVILKARQLGFSTFIMIYMLDCALFNSNQSCGVIAHTRNDAQELFRNKIKFAYDNLPDELLLACPANIASQSKIEFENGSSIVIGTSLRGGTFQKLHISEYGKIAARYPEKALEIKTGALNAIHAGQQVFVESTAEGQQGEFFDLCEHARKLNDLGKELSPLEPKFHFFPWFDNPSYIMGKTAIDNTSLNSELIEYFDRLPIELEPGRKAWYANKEAIMQEHMKREFPSTPEEAFEASLEGAYYTKQMTMVRKNKQITHVPYEPSTPVYTFWDIGKGRDDMAIWFFQHIGNRYNFINYHESSNEDWSYYVNLLQAYGYTYGQHVWPHDGGHKVGAGITKTNKQLAQELGINPIKIVSRTNDVQSDIMNKCRPVLPRCWFDAENCATGIKRLDGYRKEWDEKLGVWKDKPRHDANSHAADAFRTFACGYDGRRNELDATEDDYYFPRAHVPQIANNEYDLYGV